MSGIDPATIILGLISSVASGVSTAAMSNSQKAAFFRRMGMLKPKETYSKGIDPQMEAMLGATFMNRGMFNPYADMKKKQTSTISPRRDKVMRNIARRRG